ncbi:hypothetical protein WAX46_11165 [Bacillus sp. FJAT-53060]|uniref:hypothetical protein n=1 Tax=Bacillus sp. FJAT-53060 TaxID=3127666 RepID=UPI003013ED92
MIADGKTDCTANLNKCLEWTKAQGYSHVWLPSGTYLVDALYRGDYIFSFPVCRHTGAKSYFY